MGFPDLKKSDLKDPRRRRDWVETLLTQETALFSAGLLLEELESLETQIERIHMISSGVSFSLIPENLFPGSQSPVLAISQLLH